MSLKHRHDNGTLSAFTSHVTIFVGPQCVELLIRGISRRLRKTFQRSLAESGSQSHRCHSASHGLLVGGSCAATRGCFSSAVLIITQARIISAQCSFDGTSIMGSTNVDVHKIVLLSFCGYMLRFILLLNQNKPAPCTNFPERTKTSWTQSLSLEFRPRSQPHSC